MNNEICIECGKKVDKVPLGSGLDAVAYIALACAERWPHKLYNEYDYIKALAELSTEESALQNIVLRMLFCIKYLEETGGQMPVIIKKDGSEKNPESNEI